MLLMTEQNRAVTERDGQSDCLLIPYAQFSMFVSVFRITVLNGTRTQRV